MFLEATMTDDTPQDDDDVVGPGRPPRKHRWTPGQSGNPNGRPKGSINIVTASKKEGRKMVKYTEGGRTKTMSKMELSVLQAWQKAIKGDLKAFALMLQLDGKLDDVQAAGQRSLAIPKLDPEAMRRLAERVLRNTKGADES
jgi:hypothetical protein